MGLQNVCDGLVEETDGLLACIVLDLDTGLTLATSCREGMDATTVGAVTRRLGSLFRSRSLGFVPSSPTPTSRGVVREAQITTVSAYHFMATVPGWDSALLVFVTEKAVSIGLGWMAVHQAIDRVLQARPGAAETEAAHEASTAAPATTPDQPATPTDRAMLPEHGAAPLAGQPAASEQPAAPERSTAPAQSPAPERATAPERSAAPERPAEPDLPAPEEQTVAPLRGVGPAATARDPVVPPVPRRVASPATRSSPRLGASLERDRSALGSRTLQESTQSVPLPGNAEPRTRGLRDTQAKRTAPESPTIRNRRPSSVPADNGPADPADEDKTEVGRVGARAVFGSKTRRP